MNDGSNVTGYMFEIAYESRYTNDGLQFAQLDSTLEGVTGLQDVELAEVAIVV